MIVNDIPVEILATGSGGNAYIIDRRLMIDCGVPFRDLEPYVDDLALVLISHEHSDHLKRSTVRRLAHDRPTLRWCVGYFLVQNLLDLGVNPNQLDIIYNDKILDYGAYKITCFPLVHDVQNYGFTVRLSSGRLVWYATDTENLNGIECKNSDLYLIESNYITEENNQRRNDAVAAGEYWYAPEKRHLSYEQACEWLANNAGPDSQWLFIHGHGGVEQCVL